MDKVPYILVVGDEDVNAGSVGVNRRGGDRPARGVDLEPFVGLCQAEVDSRGLPETGAFAVTGSASGSAGNEPCVVTASERD